jgi:hypothetical protein
MTRNRRRFGSLARPAAVALGLVGLALLPSRAPAQGRVDLKPYRMEGGSPFGRAQTQMNDMRSGRVRVNGPDKEANLKVLQEFARNRIYRVTYASYYTLPEAGELKPRTGEQNLDVLIADLKGLLLVPTPAGDLDRLDPNQAEYVIEFGAALDRAIRDVFEKNPPLIIRVNVARLLAIAAETGAPALGESVLALLTNTYFKDKAGKPLETPPEVLYYALNAAANFLDARDLKALKTQFVNRHNLPDAKLVQLVKVLEAMVTDGPPVADKAAPATVDAFGRPIAVPENSAEDDAKPDAAKPGPAPVAPKADAKPDAAKPGPAPVAPKADTKPAAKEPWTPEQSAVVRYYRRAALKALARVRFDTVGGRGGPETRPAYTLAKVAVSDATLALPTAPDEAAEAVIGLAGMAPINTVTDLNLSAWSSAMASGVFLYAQPRAADPTDRALLWKITAARMDAALKQLKAAVKVSPKLRVAEKPINDLCDVVTADVLAPLMTDSQAGADRPRTERLGQWLKSNAPPDASRSLYNDSPNYKLTFRTN